MIGNMALYTSQLAGEVVSTVNRSECQLMRIGCCSRAIVKTADVKKLTCNLEWRELVKGSHHEQ